MAKRRHLKEEELELTTLLNIMVVLVSFLLLSAIFSQTTIQELNMPPQAGGHAGGVVTQPLIIEVFVRKDVLEIGDGKTVTDTLPKRGDKYDTGELSQKLKLLKDRDPAKKDAFLLMEPDIDYATMIGVMDALKFVEVSAGKKEGAKTLRIALFPNVTVGDAP